MKYTEEEYKAFQFLENYYIRNNSSFMGGSIKSLLVKVRNDIKADMPDKHFTQYK